MLITNEWSAPISIPFGKNIIVTTSHPNFAYKIFSTIGRSVEGIIKERLHTIDAGDELIGLIRTPLISFRAITTAELHVNFQIADPKD